MSDFIELPPLMGFPQEGHVDPPHNCDFYKCVVGPFRVFVWGDFDHWLTQVVVNGLHNDAITQFRNTHTKHYRTPKDPITLMCVIHRLTSESNDDATTHPSSADEDVLALHE